MCWNAQTQTITNDGKEFEQLPESDSWYHLYNFVGQWDELKKKNMFLIYRYFFSFICYLASTF